MSDLTPARLALLKLTNTHCEVLVVGMVELAGGEVVAAEGVDLLADWYDVIVTTHAPGGDLLEVLDIESNLSLSSAKYSASCVAALLLGDPHDYVVT